MTTLKKQTKIQAISLFTCTVRSRHWQEVWGSHSHAESTGGPYHFPLYLHPGSHSFPSQDTPRAQSPCAPFSLASFAVTLLLLSTDTFHKDARSSQPRPRRPFCGSVQFPCAAGPLAACVCPPWLSWHCWCSRALWRILHDTRASACWYPRRSSWCFRPSWPAAWTRCAAQDNRRQPFESWIYKTKIYCIKLISHQVSIYLSELLHLYTPSWQLRSSADTWVFRIPSFKQSPVVSALSLTRLHLSGTNSLFLSAILPLSAPLNRPWKPFSF